MEKSLRKNILFRRKFSIFAHSLRRKNAQISAETNLKILINNNVPKKGLNLESLVML